ncbi:tetratricopeptide repeat protein [Sphingobacterium sp. HMA12]|uniref:tetratricopeptide repeat protein n=1 Tax=Sphingobacterium sp. HMA12 TaxID=2050894 RepID=UPI001315898F|nr:tetratricopeptide repeat protein [Sphingobacterium sp. HMA12]
MITIIPGRAVFGMDIMDSNSSAEEKNFYETIIQESQRHRTSSATLSRYLTPYFNQAIRKNDNALLAIYYCLLADQSFDSEGGRNSFSDKYYLKALDLEKDYNYLNVKAWVKVMYGFYLYRCLKASEALPLLLEGEKGLEDIPTELMLDLTQTYKKLGYFFGTLGDYRSGIKYLELGQQQADISPQLKAEILDNLGVLTLKSGGDTVQAMKSFELALNLALSKKDSLRYAKVLGNQARIYEGRKDYKKALSLLDKDLEISKSLGNNKNTIFALMMRIRLRIAMGENQEVSQLINETEHLLEGADDKKTILELEEHKLNLAIQNHDLKQELNARRRIEQLQDSLRFLDGDPVLSQLKFMADKQKYADKLSLAQALIKKKRAETRLWVILSLFVLVLFFFIYNAFRYRSRKRMQAYEYQLLNLKYTKAELDKELMSSKSQIEEYMVYLKRNNEQINLLSSMLDEMGETSAKDRDELKTLLQSHLITDEKWQEFKLLLAKEFPNLLQDIQAKFPDITESNLRVIVLMKMGLNNREVANVLGVTPDAIKKSMQRLKKKLGGQAGILMEYISDKEFV